MAGLSVILAENVHFDSVTHSPATGGISDADSPPTFVVFEEDSDSPILSGTMTKRGALTGNYRGTFAASTGNGFEVGKYYNVVASATVGGIEARCVALTFRCDDEIAAQVWDAPAAEHTEEGSMGDSVQTAGSIAGGTVGDLDTASIPYLSVDEFLKRCDQRTAARLVSDNDVPVAFASLPTNENLEAALADASGTIESAALQGGRYSSAQLAGLTGMAQAHLFRLVTRLTICYLYERRPLKSEPPPWYWDDVMKQLDMISQGTRIFPYVETQEAGLLDIHEDTRHVIDDVRKTTAAQLAGRRFFGMRINRRWE